MAEEETSRRLAILEAARFPSVGGEERWTAGQVKEVLGREVERYSTSAERALHVAAEEREKSAQILRSELTRSVEQGDQALKAHISQQFEQYRIMLEALRREHELRATEQEKAILKAEAANEKRFESVNEFRQQLTDLVNAHQREKSELVATLMPREVAEARMTEQANKIDANTSRIDRGLGQEQGENATRTRSQVNQNLIIGVVVMAVIVIGAIVAVANAVT